MSTNAKRTNLNVVLGLNTEGEVVIAEGVFEYNPDFRGTQGVIVRPVYPPEIQAAIEPDEKRDYYEDSWRYEVSNQDTHLGLAEWVERIDDSEYIDSRFEQYHTLSTQEIAAVAGIEVPERFEYRSLGRIFPSALEGLTLIDSDEVRAAVALIHDYERVPEFDNEGGL